MGVNIWVTRIKKRSTAETWGGRVVPFYETESQEWFDSLRHYGDSEFIVENEFITLNNGDEESMIRPADFEKCREWVRKNIEVKPERLLEALSKMEKDEDLYFDYSF